MNTLLTVELDRDYHEKYLGPQHKAEYMLPDLARQVGQALLDAGALRIVDHGPATAADERDGYHRFTVRVSVLNPLSSLATSHLSQERVIAYTASHRGVKRNRTKPVLLSNERL